MKKIQSLFKRDYKGTRQVYNELVPGSEWVQNGEGFASRKWDGTSCAIIDGDLYKRYDVKKGRSVPEGAIPCEEKPNEHTGHWPHWVKCDRNKKEDQWHWAGYDRYCVEINIFDEVKDGTYELVGPKVNGNKDGFDEHTLRPHGNLIFSEVPTDFDELKEYLKDKNIEGIVWHHSDGRMVKIKKKDFGLKW